MIKIKFSEQKIWSSRSKVAIKLQDALKANNPIVELDFDGVLEISPSFANQLVLELSKITELKNIEVVNGNEGIKKIIKKQKEIYA